MKLLKMDSAKKTRIVVDRQQLAEYFNKQRINYADALNLNIANEIIVNASVYFMDLIHTTIVKILNAF